MVRVSTSTADIYEFVLPSEKDAPEEQRTTWLLRPVSARGKRRIVTAMPDARESSDARTRLQDIAFEEGVEGWRNLQSEDGLIEPVHRPGTRIIESTQMDMLPYEVFMAIATKVIADVFPEQSEEVRE